MAGEINLNPKLNTFEPTTQIQQQLAGNTTKANEITKSAVELLVGTNIRLTRNDDIIAGLTGKKTDGATNVPSLDNPGDLKQVEANLEKLIAFLKMDNDERQAEMAKGRIETNKATFESEHASRKEKIQETINKMEEAERTRKAQKAFGWLMAALAVVVAVVACVATGGAAVGPIVGAVIAVGCQVLSETGVMEKMTDGLAKALESAGLSKEAAKIVAQVAISVAILAASLGAGFSGASAIAEASKTIANLVRVATTVVGLASLGTSVAGVVQNYEAGTSQADLSETEKFIAMLKQRLEESEEELKKIIDAIQNAIAQVAQLIESSTDTSSAIANQIGQMA